MLFSTATELHEMKIIVLLQCLEPHYINTFFENLKLNLQTVLCQEAHTEDEVTK